MAQRGTKARIDLIELEKLCRLQCTDEEVAAWFNVSTRTIERRRKQKKFAEVMERGKARGRVSVRRMQMKLLEAGNATMGVWLGKNILGQVDQVTVAGDGPMILLGIPRSLPADWSADSDPEPVTIDIGSSSNESQRLQRTLEAGEPTKPVSLESQPEHQPAWRTR
jgi:hypothetical protein